MLKIDMPRKYGNWCFMRQILAAMVETKGRLAKANFKDC